MNWRFLAVAALSLLLAPVRAENFPFPQHVTYTAGAIKPAFAQAALDSAVTTFYNAWKAKYLVNGCASNHYYVYYSVDYTPSPANAITCSEAHGYGMLIAALMAGYDVNARTYFDGMFRFFTNHPSAITPNLMAWQQITGCVNEPTGGNDTATDGDLDIAYALLLADRQWGSAGEINYLAEARKVIAAVMSGEVNASAWSLRLGDWATSGNSHGFAWATGTRPSDFMPDHFRAYQLFSGNTNWARVVDKCYQIVGVIQTNNSPATGLVPDFVVNADTTAAPAPASYLEGSTDLSYAYNSCRVPWRLATDYLVSGDARAKVAVGKINSWIQAKTSGNPANIKDGYNITNGAALSGTSYSLAFAAPFAVGAMVNATNQVWLDKLWTNVTSKVVADDAYFGNTIKLLDLIILSGNWWTPALKPAVLTPPARLADGSFRLQAVVEPQFTNRLEASTNLADWSALLVTNPVAATVTIVDTQAAALDRRFYRSR